MPAPELLRLLPLLGLFWLVLSGHYTPLLLALGLVSVLLVGWLVSRMDALDGAVVHLGSPARAALYTGWLTGQVLLSAVAVLRQVWSPRPAPRPVVAATPTGDLSEVGTVAYANSITLTPGTLSLRVDEDGVEVHALRESGIGQLRDGAMLRRVRRLGLR
ncbi:MAG: Na+/H+ antiporter subunit E [Pseudonocardia sp.]